MATLLDCYRKQKSLLETGMQNAKLAPNGLWQYQELLYRIEVLETCQILTKSAPESAEMKNLLGHYQVTDAYIENLKTERKCGLGVGEDLQKKRDTAYNSLCKVIQDYRDSLRSFSPGNDTSYYGKMITKVIMTLIPVWVQYRQTYVEISKENVQ
jgi:hypothetical protein